MRKSLLALIFLLFPIHNANAQMLVLGSNDAADCYHMTAFANEGSKLALKTCRAALALPLSPKDKAATYVNLGVLQMRASDYEESRASYAKAINLAPKLSEAYINFGAALYYMGEYKESIETVTKAIELGTVKMSEALYNRAIAYDALQDYKSAYVDLRKALSLRPDWKLASDALMRYDVKSPS